MESVEEEITDLPSVKASANDLIYADTHKTEPTGYAGIVVSASNVLTTNGVDSSFTIQAVDASNTDRYCKIRICRKSKSAYAGKVFLTDSLSSGTTVELLHQAVKDEIEEHRIFIPAGKILGVSVVRNTSDFLYIEMFNFVSPTDYSGGDARVFNHILCIGDSLTQGVFNATANKVQYSYPTYLSKLTGSAVTNLGVAGITSQQWYETYQNSEVLEGHDCCIIQLGVNDNPDTIDTVTITALRNIIALLKQKNPYCHIFLAGIINGLSYKAAMSTDTYFAKDQAIKALYESDYSNDSQVHLIDHVKYGHLRIRIYSMQNEGGYSGYSDDFNEGHLTAYGYWRLALDYYNYISYIMHTDDNKVFKDIQRNTVIN
jgi:lysophospholipase L1-like esterase